MAKILYSRKSSRLKFSSLLLNDRFCKLYFKDLYQCFITITRFQEIKGVKSMKTVKFAVLKNFQLYGRQTKTGTCLKACIVVNRHF